MVFFKVCAFLLAYLTAQLYFCVILSSKFNNMKYEEYFDLAAQSLDCEHEGLHRVQVGEYTFEHRFTPNSGACLFACTVFNGPLIGYCATYENGYSDLLECVIEAIRDLS